MPSMSHSRYPSLGLPRSRERGGAADPSGMYTVSTTGSRGARRDSPVVEDVFELHAIAVRQTIRMGAFEPRIAES